ncbi:MULTISPECIES: DUF3047 domain-containing protein [Halomonadaceae]|uniref:DUF3047 domain-containing protein n=1 Tax=Halomonadaceae TaxID=28256 RepID=UPI00158437ED|nr:MULTISPECIES: DUF3047 domain-containing protein [Halomonas]MDI4636642.1 DUF3047 domain-containing protein [Halomonas sp. BMC7]NUJ61007.1 DUF3047 domain-containing protein [Halomonas taeanensis]
MRHQPCVKLASGLSGLLVAGLGLSALAEPLQVAEISFSPSDILGWPMRDFDGETDYRLVELDGEQVLRAQARGQASAKYLEQEIDLDRTPYLHWCWRVASTYPGLVETTKGGDDYPARVYVARKTGWLPFQVQSVNYVWSSNQVAGSAWPNAFTERAQLLALEGKEAPVGQWVAEVRDVREDFSRLFGERPARLSGVALMTDGDNAGGDATAWYARLAFSDASAPPRCPGQ